MSYRDPFFSRHNHVWESSLDGNGKSIARKLVRGDLTAVARGVAPGCCVIDFISVAEAKRTMNGDGWNTGTIKGKKGLKELFDDGDVDNDDEVEAVLKHLPDSVTHFEY